MLAYFLFRQAFNQQTDEAAMVSQRYLTNIYMETFEDLALT
jgi:hypothetical protein